MSDTSTLPVAEGDGGDLSFQVRDPNNTAWDADDFGMNEPVKYKITKTSMDGESGQATGSSYEESIASMKGRMPTDAPGNGSGALTDNNGQGNSSGIPAAQPIDVLTFGDPNESSLDFRDGSDPNTVTIKGGSTHTGGGAGDIENYGFDKPSMPDGRKMKG